MKIIDKVLKENPNKSRQSIIKYHCPSHFGYVKDTPRHQGGGEYCERCWNREIKEPRNVGIQIENIHEAWELKRALKRTIEEKNIIIKNLRLEEITMKEVGMTKDAIDASVTKRITSLERDKKTCIKLIRKLNVYVYPEEGVLC